MTLAKLVSLVIERRSKLYQLTAIALAGLLWGCSPAPTTDNAQTVPEAAPAAPIIKPISEISANSEKSDIPSKKLDLSRVVFPGEAESLTDSDLVVPKAALPDLFEASANAAGKRLSTSGRVLTDESAGVSVDAIEGVELSIELKTN